MGDGIEHHLGTLEGKIASIPLPFATSHSRKPHEHHVGEGGQSIRNAPSASYTRRRLPAAKREAEQVIDEGKHATEPLP